MMSFHRLAGSSSGESASRPRPPSWDAPFRPSRAAVARAGSPAAGSGRRFRRFAGRTIPVETRIVARPINQYGVLGLSFIVLMLLMLLDALPVQLICHEHRLQRCGSL